MYRWEWAICEALVLGFAIYEWFSIRRELKRSREQQALEEKIVAEESSAD